MSRHLTYGDTKRQSLSVYGQFGESLWIPNAKENAKLERLNSNDLQNVGLGKCLLLVAMGASLEEEIETIKKYRDRVDILACDKAFVPLMEHGVTPDYVMVCDASIPARYFETHVLKTKTIKLLATPYANTLWTKPWLGPRYFFVNKDAIESEKIFIEIMGRETRVIPASSNVSNAMVVFMTGCDETKRINWAGYERYFLIGYDYSWQLTGNYYAWNDPKPKRYYMHHITSHDMNGNIIFTSGNLMFSARWLYDYLRMHKLPVYNCSKRGILQIANQSTLETELSAIRPNREGAVRSIKQGYQVLKSILEAQAYAQNTFERAREAIWQ